VRPLLGLAVAACFLGSLLLFSFEPFVGKLLLPSFGGTPLLWNTCMVFFQVALLAGYLYAMALTRIGTPRVQVLLHLVVVAALFVTYPGAGTQLAHAGTSPLPALLGWLTGNALLPFLALAALATLVQSWFSRSGHPSASNPYRLYAASNAGSMVGLFAYPLAFEPLLSLGAQRSTFLGLVALLIGVLVWFAASWSPSTAEPSAATTEEGGQVPTVEWLKLVGLTAVPSSLLLGVTNYILTDIASIPFFWTIPLALYLLTFIIAFDRPLHPLPQVVSRLTSLALLVVVATLCAEANSPASFLIPLHLVVFFLACLHCHVRVTSLQPPTRLLPQYYLAISLGGAVGGMLTLLVPPLLTDSLVEYPTALMLASIAIVPGVAGARGAATRVLDLAVPAALVLAGTWAAAKWLPDNSWGPALPWLPAAFYTLAANERGTVFATRLAAIVATSLLVPSPYGHTIFAERNFFGRVRVTEDAAGEFHKVVHGSTIHGIQKVSGMSGCHPASYFYPTGPAGRYLTSFPATAPPMHVGLIGLGSGALTCYARPGDRWDLFELNPAMARVASDPKLFTFVTNSPAVEKNVVLGDARIEIAAKPEASYDLIIIDAFSSDAIPLHLLTQEAIATYATRLKKDGTMLFHISNRFFRLEPVVASVAALSGFEGRVFEDLGIDEADALDGKTASTWMVLARPAQAASLPAEWKHVEPGSGRPWTDEYSNPLGAMKWGSGQAG
jgi:hypothetical protein